VIEQFIQERVYLKGVTNRTVEWYRGSFRVFAGAIQTKQSITGRTAE